MQKAIHFEPLESSHLSLIHEWFNLPHVQAFYSLRFWTLAEVEKKLAPVLSGEKKIRAFLICLLETPIGYIQSYCVSDFPWIDQGIDKNIEKRSGAFDLFIGEEKSMRKGLGKEIVNRFLADFIFPLYDFCFCDPDVRNQASLHLFFSCGFRKHKTIHSKDALGRDCELELLIKEKVS